MNYKLHYDRLMERAPKTKIIGKYREGHHVVPKCMGGAEGSIVYLTPEEHYVAHLLLVKIYPGHRGILYGAHALSMDMNGQEFTTRSLVGSEGK
ncbi:MAG: hypothetical protein ACREQ5_08640 [Candidatus Dormibacteria bacterium]